MSILLSIKNILREGKRNGIKGIIKYIKERLIRKYKYLVVEIDLKKTIPLFNTSQNIEFKVLKPSDEIEINRLVSFWVKHYISYYPLYTTEKLIRKLILSRLEAKELCFIGKYRENIIYFQWISLLNKCKLNKNEPVRYLDFIPLKNTYSYNIILHPEFRHKDIFQSGYAFIIKHLKEMGCEKIISCIKEENIASIKAHIKFSQPTKIIDITKYLFFQKVLIRKYK